MATVDGRLAVDQGNEPATEAQRYVNRASGL